MIRDSPIRGRPMGRCAERRARRACIVVDSSSGRWQRARPYRHHSGQGKHGVWYGSLATRCYTRTLAASTPSGLSVDVLINTAGK